MMERGPYRQRKPGAVYSLALILVFSACGSLLKGKDSSANFSSQSDEKSRLPSASRSLAAELSATEATNGSIVRVTVRVPGEMLGQKLSATFEGNEIPLFPVPSQGAGVYEAVLGIPFVQKPGILKVAVRAGEGDAARTLELPVTVKEGTYPSSELKVAPKYTNPDPKSLKRILSEQKEIGKIYRTITPVKYWSGPFVLPVSSSRITGVFGTKRMFNGAMQSFHKGLDLAAAVGTPIVSPAGGKVVLAKDLYFTGNTVLLDHGYGVFTIYAHMSRIDVKLGQEVKTRQQLGLAGATGRVTGPHLHWGAVVHREKVNPEDLTRVMR